MVGVRQDVASFGPGWNRPLLNYALAMGELDKLPIGNRNSWKFLGAMHGFDRDMWVDARIIKPSDEITDDLTGNSYGNQCQHGSWFFLPWHRGYLAAFEAIVAAKVKALTGDDWTLPYWNYLDDTNPDALKIPDAFLEPELPDGRPNPLRKYPRRKNITRLPDDAPADEFSLDSMAESDFLVGLDGSVGFGGGITGDFVQFSRRTGDLEANPHNTVHGMIGGFMGNALTAGLDPLFWLHHCNIDRLWEAWMGAEGRTMVHDSRWSDGPADREFVMPAVGGADPGIAFTARDTLKGGKFCPRYDDLIAGTAVQPGAATVARVGMGPPSQQKVDPIGANAGAVTVGEGGAATRVDLEPAAAANAVTAMGAFAAGEEVSRLYLKLDGVRGSAPSPLMRVYVNLPEGGDPERNAQLRAGSIRMFGLNVASEPDGDHGGNGLGYTLDITDLAARLSEAGDFDPDHLRVTLVPVEGISDETPVTVDRIAVLRRSGVVS